MYINSVHQQNRYLENPINESNYFMKQLKMAIKNGSLDDTTLIRNFFNKLQAPENLPEAIRTFFEENKEEDLASFTRKLISLWMWVKEI